MSENKDKEKLDAFSKALLDKKVDMKLHPEAYTETKKVNLDDRTKVEKSMSSALDMLRLERGQKTIEQEEIDFAVSQKKKENTVEEYDDFTTSSIEQEAEQNELNLVHTLLQDMSENVNENEEELEEDPLFEKLKEKKEEYKLKKENKDKKKNNKKTKTKKGKKPKKIKKKNKVLNAIVIVLLLGLVALGGYTYKVMIYDPQNIVSDSQQETYDKLVSYADEYGDNMMSDAEKLELINLDEGYQKLLEKQKTSINTYFKEQTNKTYKALLKEIKVLKKTQEENSYPAYQEILNILNSWDTMSDVDKMGIVDKQNDFNALPSDLQTSINKLSKEKTGKNFTDLCSDESTLKNEYEQQKAQEEEQKAQNEQTKAAYEQALAQVQANYSAYQAYGQSLQQDLATAQQNGEDTSELQTAIDTNNQMLNELSSQIVTYQQQIEALQ